MIQNQRKMWDEKSAKKPRTRSRTHTFHFRNLPQITPAVLEQLSLEQQHQQQQHLQQQLPQHQQQSLIKTLDMGSCFQNMDTLPLRIIHEKWMKTVLSLNLEYCQNLTDGDLAVLLGCEENCPPNPSATLPLRKINLSHTNITDLGIRVLVQRCPKLKRITLKACQSITNKSLSMIAQHCKNIAELNIAECRNITDYGVQIILQQSKTNLSLLDLNDCSGVTDSILPYLCYYCPNIKQLRLRGTHLSAQAISHTVSKLALTELNVHGLDICDEVLHQFGYHLKKLQTLDLSFCYSLTVTGLRALLKGCPMLRELHLFGINLTQCEIDTLQRSDLTIFC